MRKLAPHLDLQGDTQKAKAWIPWAQKQIERLKRLNVAGLVNQTLRPINGCIVSLRSVNGADYIRISILDDGVYTCEFPNVITCAPAFCSDFQLLCRVNHQEIGVAARTGWGHWDNYHWIWGDGNEDDGDEGTWASGFHEYDSPGKYTMSLTVSVDPTVTIVGSPEDLNSAEHKIGSSLAFYPPGGIDATAWANFVASSGTTQNEGAFYYATATRTWQDKRGYFYESQDQDIDFDLTGVNPLATCTLIVQALRLDTVVHYPNYGDPQIVVANGEVGISSSIGGFAKPVIGGAFAPWEDLECGDMTPFIGTVKNITLTRSPTAQLPQYMGGLPVPGFASSVFNRIGVLSSQAWVKVVTPGETKTTTKVIKVNTGTPKKTRQIGESVHT